MKRPLVSAITYMRGICMLGVIAIHIGAVALTNPLANEHLIGLLEIVSRFTVPAFFFLSAFGLFYSNPLEETFSYERFLRKRAAVVVYPYIAWTLLYLVYNAYVLGDVGGLMPHYIVWNLLFGTGMYHLYFMVILIWFYVYMPLWRRWLSTIQRSPYLWFTILFIVQVVINFWSSYRAGSVHFENSFLNYLFSMRLNYSFVFYIWIFMFGAYIGNAYDTFKPWLVARFKVLTLACIISLLAMLGSYYYVIYVWNYTLLEAVYTIHQLSPIGMVYMAVACVYGLSCFERLGSSRLFQQLGEASYGMYLVHPFIIILCTSWIDSMGLLYTSGIVILLYVLVAVVSYMCTKLLSLLPNKTIRLWILGK